MFAAEWGDKIMCDACSPELIPSCVCSVCCAVHIHPRPHHPKNMHKQVLLLVPSPATVSQLVSLSLAGPCFPSTSVNVQHSTSEGAFSWCLLLQPYLISSLEHTAAEKKQSRVLLKQLLRGC